MVRQRSEQEEETQRQLALMREVMAEGREALATLASERALEQLHVARRVMQEDYEVLRALAQRD